MLNRVLTELRNHSRLKTCSPDLREQVMHLIDAGYLRREAFALDTTRGGDGLPYLVRPTESWLTAQGRSLIKTKNWRLVHVHG